MAKVLSDNERGEYEDRILQLKTALQDAPALKYVIKLRDEIKELKAENKKLKNQKEYIYKKELAQMKIAIEDAIERMDDEPAKKILEQALKGGE